VGSADPTAAPAFQHRPSPAATNKTRRDLQEFEEFARLLGAGDAKPIGITGEDWPYGSIYKFLLPLTLNLGVLWRSITFETAIVCSLTARIPKACQLAGAKPQKRLLQVVVMQDDRKPEHNAGRQQAAGSRRIRVINTT
jgi:hypothetical protein